MLSSEHTEGPSQYFPPVNEPDSSNVPAHAKHTERVKRAGFLLKLEHSETTQAWTRYWCYLLEDRLCFQHPVKVVTEGIHYVPLDRIVVRARPRGYKPSIGVTLADNKHLHKGDPAFALKKKAAAFSIQCGINTHWLAAETARDAQAWVASITEQWEHCILHATRAMMVAHVDEFAVHLDQQLQGQQAEISHLKEELAAARQQGNSTACADLETQIQDLTALIAKHSRATTAAGTPVESSASPPLDAMAGTVHLAVQADGDEWSPGGQDAYTVETATTSSQVDDSSVVFIELVGITTSEKLILIGSQLHSQPFQPGNVDRFTVKCPDVGLLQNVKLSLQSDEASHELNIAEVRVCRAGTDFWTYFPCGTTMEAEGPAQGAQQAGQPEGSRSKQSKDLEALTVTFYTSDVRGAGTAADAMLTMQGADGQGRQHLIVNQGRRFNRGAEDTATVRDDISLPLKSITVASENPSDQSGWLLDRVQITHEETQQTFLFPCGKRLQYDSGDGWSRVKLPAARDGSEEVAYRLTIRTSDLPEAGTDAEKLTIQHDNSGRSPAWHLDSVEVTNEATGETVFFPFWQWLARDMGDGQIQRTSLATNQGAPGLGGADNSDDMYTIQVVTSDVNGAGTTAGVSLRLHGDQQQVSSLQHIKALSGCQRGAVDRLSFRSEELGTPSKIWIEQDCSGPEPHWHLKEIRVQRGQRPPIVFPCNRWLSKQLGDMTAGRFLYPSDATQRPQVSYTASIHTSDIQGAGTSAQVYLEVTGKSGTGVPQCMEGSFQEGDQDMCSWEGADVGELTSLRVWHDGSGGSPSWHLDLVEIVVTEASGNDTTYYFPCDQWLDTSQGTQCMLSAERRRPQKQTTSYIITVHPSPEETRGVPESLAITAHGARDSSGPHALKFDAASYRRLRDGRAASCHVSTKDVRAVEILTLEILDLDVDSAHPWTCQMITLEHADTGDTRYFTYDSGSWNNEHGRWTVDSHANLADPRKAEREYVITALTSEVRHTAAKIWSKVFIEITGSIKGSGPQLLLNPGDELSPKRVDSVTLQLDNLGELEKIEIYGSSHAKSATAWHLDMVYVDDSATGTRYYFPCRKWLRLADGLQHKIPVVQHDPNDDLSLYTITVSANAELVAAGPEAFVHMDIQGSSRSSGPRMLAPEYDLNGLDAIAWVGQVELLLPDLGQIREVVVGHKMGGGPSAAGWQLEMLTVAEAATGRTYHFNPHYHLDETRDGGFIQRRVKAVPAAEQSPTAASRTLGQSSPFLGTGAMPYYQDPMMYQADPMLQMAPADMAAFGLQDPSPYPMQADLGMLLHRDSSFGFADPSFPMEHHWVAEVSTSDRVGAGTSAFVYIELHGLQGSSGRIPLTGPGVMQRGAIDVFTLNSSVGKLGDIVKVTLGHGNQGTAPSWRCEHVAIKCLTGNDSRTIMFPVDRWFSTELDDGRIERNFYPVTGGDDLYRVSFYTARGDSTGLQGASHVVYLLTGMKGTLGPVSVPANTGAGFHKGSVTDCNARAYDLGELIKLQVWLTDKVGQPADKSWHLEKVAVIPPQGDTYIFKCNAWVEQDQVALFPSFDPLHVSYMVSIMTSNHEKAGPLLPIQLSIKGDQGASKQISLPLQPGSFQPGQMEKHEVQLPYLGSLQSVTIGNPSVKMRWHLDHVVIREQWTGKEAHFPCRRWLHHNYGDCKTVLTLKRARVWPQEQHAYAVEIVTNGASRPRIAGPAYAEFHGRSNSTGVQAMLPSSGSFLAGTTETCFLQAPECGGFTHMVLYHNDEGGDWRLDTVRITDQTSGKETLFDCRLSLNSASVYSCKASVGQAPVPHLVEVFTSDQVGSSYTDMSLIIVGDLGEAGPFELANDDQCRFLQNAHSQFHVDLPDIGTLQKALIQQQDNTKGGGSVSLWHLGWISITNLGTQVCTWFPCNRFVDARQEILEGFIPDPGYNFLICTSNKLGSGTTCTVSLELVGDRQRSGLIPIDNTKAQLRRGGTDPFAFPGLAHMGTLKSLRIVVTPEKQLFPGWRPKTIAVTYIPTGEVTFFHNKKHIGKPCGYQITLSPGLAPVKPLKQPPAPPPALITSEVEQWQTIAKPPPGSTATNVPASVPVNKGPYRRDATGVPPTIMAYARG
ncbi:hypothetical protein WJX73_008749 [Symbiochloris irregularis]|uniref:Lipoxygenase homology domain-containing protein 1 n=1 Tax=Symbiochloris irregularis TaxID=706552 RepID=A0AAW1PNV1_9CHLO